MTKTHETPLLPGSVMDFFRSLFDQGINFHPDTPFGDYVDSDGTPVYTPSEANRLDAYLELCFRSCDWYGEDIYALCLRAYEGWEQGLDVHPSSS